MKPVKQEHPLGCAVACTAFLIGVDYQKTILLFEDGVARVQKGFFCKDIISVLQKAGLSYQNKFVAKNKGPLKNSDNSIVYIRKSPAYPWGHYLCKAGDRWMDPWINYPDLDIKAGFRDELPGEPQYAMIPKLK
jgi:hypothetical protein